MLIYLQMMDSTEDKDKFEAIYLAYRGLMFHVANQILRNQQDAEDAVHQAFLSVIKNLDKISDVQCPKTRSFLVIIVERKAIDLLRKSHFKDSIPLDDDIAGIEVPLPGDHGLADALASLPARYREILLLRFDNGYSAKELAEILNMSRDSVQKLIWRAKEALTKAMERGEC